MAYWDDTLNDIYHKNPSGISLIEGNWKTGKTDFSLFLAVDELKDRLAIIKEVASNIKTNDPRVNYVNNFSDLETFLFRNRDRKAFIYDEAIKSSPSRSAMSKLNVTWLKYIPELSKAKCTMFVITQEADFTEKLFLHPTWIRAKWVKKALKIADLLTYKSHHIDRFTDLPPTSVTFDPYTIATWSLLPTSGNRIIDQDILIALEYAQGERTNQIMAKYGIRYRGDLTYIIRRAIKKMYEVNIGGERSLVENNSTDDLLAP